MTRWRYDNCDKLTSVTATYKNIFVGQMLAMKDAIQGQLTGTIQCGGKEIFLHYDLIYLLCLSLFFQGCWSRFIQSGFGSIIFAKSGSGSGSGSKLKQNFRRKFLSQTFLKSKFESNQIKNTGVIHTNFVSKSS
jgi:hypothetical protein